MHGQGRSLRLVSAGVQPEFLIELPQRVAKRVSGALRLLVVARGKLRPEGVGDLGDDEAVDDVAELAEGERLNAAPGLPELVAVDAAQARYRVPAKVAGYSVGFALIASKALFWNSRKSGYLHFFSRV